MLQGPAISSQLCSLLSAQAAPESKQTQRKQEARPLLLWERSQLWKKILEACTLHAVLRMMPAALCAWKLPGQWFSHVGMQWFARAVPGNKEGRFTHPWQPARLIGWNSVWVGQCDISAMTSCQGRL